MHCIRQYQSFFRQCRFQSQICKEVVRPWVSAAALHECVCVCVGGLNRSSLGCLAMLGGCVVQLCCCRACSHGCGREWKGNGSGEELEACFREGEALLQTLPCYKEQGTVTATCPCYVQPACSNTLCACVFLGAAMFEHSGCDTVTHVPNPPFLMLLCLAALVKSP